MPRVVPSQVVSFIDSIALSGDMFVSLHTVESSLLFATVELSNQIPDELLTMDTAAYASLIQAKAQIAEILEIWTSNRKVGQNIQRFDFPIRKNPLANIRNALAECPDEAPAPGTSDLTFITDADFRANLRNDIGAINRALVNGEWKAATVLAGSAAESLLLWALKQRLPADIASAITALRESGGLTASPESNLEKWNLYELIQVAENLGVIKPKTAIQSRLAKDFRNLIHPGVAQRLGEKCDRATAFSAVAGMEHIVRDIK
jgi:hypothetical protein